jgi:hypothetical protein
MARRRLPLLFALTATAVLLGIGDVLNSARKTSSHAWCAPTSENRLNAAQSREHDELLGNPH